LRGPRHRLGGKLLLGALERGEERLDHGRVELAAGAPDELLASADGGHRGPVGAVGDHRLVGAGHREDARLERDLAGTEALGIAAPVDPLVVGADPYRDVPKAGVLEDPGADLAVAMHLLPLGVVERARLVKDGVGDPSLPRSCSTPAAWIRSTRSGSSPSASAVCLA
jgi:hypothetical protein